MILERNSEIPPVFLPVTRKMLFALLVCDRFQTFTNQLGKGRDLQ